MSMFLHNSISAQLKNVTIDICDVSGLVVSGAVACLAAGMSYVYMGGE